MGKKESGAQKMAKNLATAVSKAGNSIASKTKKLFESKKKYKSMDNLDEVQESRSNRWDDNDTDFKF